METRLYFLFGDVLANLLAGALIGVGCALLFGPGWNMWVAMAVGMPLGMLFALVLAILLGALFGAMEVMLPVMVTAMVVSMVVPMMAAMSQVTILSAAELGSVLGLCCLALCYWANARLRARRSPWIS
jgi:hypothetical protein